MSFFSIIIPTFNVERTIRVCLDSILSQTEPDFEIIIQDGKSTDQTLEVVQRFNDSRIRISSVHDEGVYDAMNKAVERASGQWLLFLGSDDYLYGNDVLSTIRYELAQSKADLLYGDVKIVGDTPWAKDGTIYRGEISLRDLMEHNYSHQAVFYHRRIFDKNRRYLAKYRVCADYDFNLFCTANYRVQYIPVIVSCFVSGGISSSERDVAFEREQWMNTVRYFGVKLRDSSFHPFRRQMRRAAKRFLMRLALYQAALAFFLYLSHSPRKRNTSG